MPAARLGTLFASDGDLRYDRAHGAVYYACGGLLPPGGGAARAHAHAHGHSHSHDDAHSRAARRARHDAAADTESRARRPPAARAPSAAPGGPDPIDPSQALRLHSRPGAPQRIVLNFQGVFRGGLFTAARHLQTFVL